MVAARPAIGESLAMHIGLIGGIGPAATDFYYRGLIDRHVAAGSPARRHHLPRRRARDEPQPRGQQSRQAGRDFRQAGRAHEGGRCEGRSHHLNGRAFLRQGTRSDLAAADPQRHSRGRCRPCAEEAEEDRHPRHAHRDGDETLRRHSLGRGRGHRRRGSRPGPQQLCRDGHHRPRDGGAAPGLFRGRPPTGRAWRRGHHAGRHRSVPGLHRTATPGLP